MYDYRASVVRVVDGDTVHLDVDLGFHVQLHDRSVRIAGINAPELPTPEGEAAKAYAGGLLAVGTKVTLYSHALDKYGRVLGSITLPDGRDVGRTMIAAGQAVVDKG